MELRWEDPPEPRRVGRPSKFEPLVAQLRTWPGKWARLANYQDAPSTADKTARSLRRRYPDCEFVARRGAVYGRVRVDGEG